MNELHIYIPKNFSVDEASQLRDKLYELLDNGEQAFLLDFKNCTFIDSTGLGVLVSIYKKSVELGASLKLTSLTPEVMRIFQLTRLDKVFNIY